MADPILHIKDSYYFEIPKVLYPYEYNSAGKFPAVWISLDPEFQNWEFERLYQELSVGDAGLPAKETTKHEWQHWVHADHANFAKPYDVFLEEKYQAQVKAFNDWKARQIADARRKDDGSLQFARKADFSDYLEQTKGQAQAADEYREFYGWRHENAASVERIKERTGGKQAIDAWKSAVVKHDVADWSKEKLAAYNQQLSGKILIPQPFATLRNFYERESGFAISKYMIIEVAIGLVILLVFSGLAKRLAQGGPPRGYLWNMLEAFLLFIRDDVVRPAIGTHHGEADHGHGPVDAHAGHAHAPLAHSATHAHSHAPAHHVDDATRLLPVFWTIFFFVLGCNLFGMLPWMGAPSSSFSVTTGLALVTFVVGTLSGINKFGVVGHLGNQIPGMDLPWYMAIFVKPLVYAIEVLGLMIKHAVLAIRLLANMVAGHLVILGIMGIAFGAAAAASYDGAPSWQWPVAATIAVVASAAFSLLELFVAFLQAYIFTFLSALFIGATLHKH